MIKLGTAIVFCLLLCGVTVMAEGDDPVSVRI